MAILISWGISSVGVFALASVYLGFSTRWPDMRSRPCANKNADLEPLIGLNSPLG